MDNISLKKQQLPSVSPDDILETDIRTINGWDSSLKPSLPEAFINQWCICITTSTYKNRHSETLQQMMIGTGRNKIIMVRQSTGTAWGKWGKPIID